MLDICIVSCFYPFWIKPPWKFMYKSFYGHIISFLLSAYLQVKLLDHRVGVKPLLWLPLWLTQFPQSSAWPAFLLSLGYWEPSKPSMDVVSWFPLKVSKQGWSRVRKKHRATSWAYMSRRPRCSLGSSINNCEAYNFLNIFPHWLLFKFPSR
jgi:hypothetical protein